MSETTSWHDVYGDGFMAMRLHYPRWAGPLLVKLDGLEYDRAVGWMLKRLTKLVGVWMEYRLQSDVEQGAIFYSASGCWEKR